MAKKVVKKSIKKAPAPASCNSHAWLPFVILAVGMIWLGNDTNLYTFNIPYLPIVVILYALGMVVYHHK